MDIKEDTNQFFLMKIQREFNEYKIKAGEFTFIPSYKTIVPSSKWTEDSNNHYLLVDLPGFKNEPRCILSTLTGEIIISGMKEENEPTSDHISEVFTLPPNSDAGKYTVKFVNEILHVTIPKVAAAVEEQKEEPEIKYENVLCNAAASAEIRKWIIRTPVEMLNKNKGIVTTAVVAFSLVMLVCRKFQSAGE